MHLRVPSYLLVIEEADLSGLHAGRLLQVGPHGVDDVNVVHLVAGDAVGLTELSAVLNRLLRDGLNRLTLNTQSNRGSNSAVLSCKTFSFLTLF